MTNEKLETWIKQSEDYAISEALKHEREHAEQLSRDVAIKHFGCGVRLVSETFDASTTTWNFTWEPL